METMQIVSWLYDKAARAMDHSYARMLNMTAKRLRELDEKQRWIPVAERLPEEDVRVLVWVGGNDCNFPMIDTDRIHNGRWVRWDGYITHWMPLPEPPKQTIIKEDN